MHCPRCQHENAPRMKFCGECGSPLNAASPTARSYADLKTEVESLRQALTQAVEQQKATAELVQTRDGELAKSLEQQTATAEILRVIASSPTDLQPVLDVVAENAARVCGGTDSLIFRLDGNVLRLVARYGTLPVVMSIGDTMSATRDSVAGRAVSERRTIHVEDLRALPEAEFPETQARARERAYAGHRTYLATPLLREDIPLGTIVIRRAEARPFTDKQIALLQTFADQAVIAIENVRLFTELQQKNDALTQAHAQVTESLEQQTATAEILRVIASSPTDLQPVMEAVVENAARRVRSDGLGHLPPGGRAPAPGGAAWTAARVICDRRVRPGCRHRKRTDPARASDDPRRRTSGPPRRSTQ